MATRDSRDTQGMTRRPAGGSRASRDVFASGAADPFSQFRRLAEQMMERWFDGPSERGPGRVSGRADSPWSMGPWSPPLEALMRGDRFVVRMDVPGLQKDELEVEVTEDAIVVQGERQESQEEDREGYYQSERRYGRFYREVPLPEGAEPDTAQANYRDGVLEITVKAAQRQPTHRRRIEIGAGPASEREGRQRASTSGSPASSERSSSRPSVAHDRESGRGGTE